MPASRASGPLRELAEAADVLRDGRSQPRGLLRVSVPTLVGQLMMGRIAAQFALAHPEVRLSVSTEDRQVDLVGEGYDLVVRVNPEPNSELVGRCFARDHVLVVSTPRLKERFFDAAPEPGEPVPVISRGPTRDAGAWRIMGPPACEVPTRTVLDLPVFTMVRDAALTGLGAARLPQVVVADDLAAGRLVSWGAATDRPSELWALHTSRRLPSAKGKAFMAFLEAEFRKAWR